MIMYYRYQFSTTMYTYCTRLNDCYGLNVQSCDTIEQDSGEFSRDLHRRLNAIPIGLCLARNWPP